MNFSWEFVLDTIKYVAMAIPMTMLLTFIPVTVGLMLGFLLAVTRIRKIPVLTQIITVYNSFFRSIPLVVLFFLVYYGLPKAINYMFHDGMRVVSIKHLNNNAVAIVTLILYAAAFLGEIVRGALSSVDMKQKEAATALGMTGWQTYIRIIIPQAIIVALPNYFNFVLALLKGTSVVFTISVVDMMSAAKLRAEYGYRYVEAYVLVGFFYIVFSILFSRIFLAIERNAKRHMGQTI
ncbi:amino acid ABC transporter permease [Butyrivibrio sp. FCS014]|uniref:amino acid ABC transporter permease n=1 Tax=Butyrivibrio sp. FCS014 TaxID=1408304 RepID=UPI000467DE54|nr:amino acid ABC transporter permease [Butyrivibrio sp. FCS014]